jgi:site-specific DNA recombinase
MPITTTSSGHISLWTRIHQSTGQFSALALRLHTDSRRATSPVGTVGRDRPRRDHCQAAARGASRRGKFLDKAALYKLLANRVYVCEAVHKGVAYPGEHQPIIDRKLWDKVRSTLQESPRARACRTRAQTPALLKGLLFGPTGRAMSPTHTRRGNKLYRYYVSQSVLKYGPDACPVRRVPAAEIEAAVVDQLRGMLRSPEVIVATWRAARSEIAGLSEDTVREALERLDPLWDELFPAEQARIVQLLVARVDVSTDGLDIHLRTQGLAHTFRELAGVGAPRRAAA